MASFTNKFRNLANFSINFMSLSTYLDIKEALCQFFRAKVVN